MRVVVVGERVVPVLAGGLVSGQGLRAGCIDGASHERPVKVGLSVRHRARCESKVSSSCARPVLMPASCSVEKPLAQHIGILIPPSL